MMWTRLPLDEIPNFPLLIDYVDHFARLRGDQEAAIDYGGRRWTHRSFAGLVHLIALDMLAQGIRPGARVAVLANPSVHAWASFIAASAIGAVWMGLNPRYTASELKRLIDDAGPELIYADTDLGGFDGNASLLSLENVADRTETIMQAVQAARAHVDPAKPCLLVYTSGSTGQPKGALLRQDGIIACSRVQAHHYGMAGSRTLNPLPINHVGALCDTATTALVCGGMQVFMSFDPAVILRVVGEEQIDLLGGVPTMFQLLVAEPSFGQTDFSSVKRLLWSGAPMPEPLLNILEQLGKPMHNFYGMTELSGSITFTDPYANPAEVAGTIGRPESSYPVRIADPASGQPCAVGTIGEIQTRSPGVFAGYHGQAQATADAFTEDGWFRTGDLAEELPDGNYVLRGRLREMFKSGGYNVYPREIETVIEAVPGVIAACVVPVPDPLFHEVGHAYVMLMPGMAVDEADFIAGLRKQLANYKVPKRVSFVAELPMLPVGKVDRRAVAAMALTASPASGD
jgi:acyl-CoA synthetase (AMP-forming)/AMP-acid ligase II